MNSIRFADTCIVTTEVNRQRLGKYFPGLKNILLYSLFHEFNKEIASFKEKDCPTEILFVLTTSPNKRWDRLLEQALILTNKYPNQYVFHLVTPQVDFFKEKIFKLYSGLEIIFHKDLSQMEMFDLYQRVHFF